MLKAFEASEVAEISKGWKIITEVFKSIQVLASLYFDVLEKKN